MMETYLVSDTNSAIKLAFVEDKFFEEDFISKGKVLLFGKVVHEEVCRHILNPNKKRIMKQLTFLKDCDYYYDLNHDEMEFWSYQNSEFKDAKEELSPDSPLGTSDNDELVLYLALINNYGLVTNEYTLKKLALQVGEVDVWTTEDLFLMAYDEGKMSKEDVQAVIDNWKEKEEYIIGSKKQAFKDKGFRT